MSRLFKTTLVLMVLAGSSRCLAQDKLSPTYFVELEKRTYDKTETLKLDPTFTYITPGTNIKINFLKDRMREAIGRDSAEDILRRLELLNVLEDSLKKERDKAIAADSSGEEKQRIRSDFESLIERRALKPKLELVGPGIKLTVKAMITMNNGKTYDVNVPNYHRVVQEEDTAVVTSVTQRVFRISTEGLLEDRIVDTEIDLLQENLRENDVVKLEIETDDDGVKRRYVKRFVISEHGWKLKFPPSVLFIKRRHEPKDSSGHAINPSDFKPAPGGSMLLSYKPKPGLGNQLLKGWSFGVNVSLLDFEIDNNLELGVGFTVYGLNHLVGGGYGWNLHASEKEDYFFISLDFLRTFETFRAIFSPDEQNR